LKDYIFSVSEVEEAVSRLKPHINKGSLELVTDHFINGGRDCLSVMAVLLTAIVVNGHLPTFINIALASHGFRHAGPSLWNSLPHHSDLSTLTLSSNQIQSKNSPFLWCRHF